MLPAATGGGGVDGSVFPTFAAAAAAVRLASSCGGGRQFAAAKATKNVDRISIAMVARAFSEGMVDGIWSRVPVMDIVILCAVGAGGVCCACRGSWRARPASIAAIRCHPVRGSKKSGLRPADGGGDPVRRGRVIILPLMIFHQIQLMMCAVYAAKCKEFEERATADAVS